MYFHQQKQLKLYRYFLDTIFLYLIALFIFHVTQKETDAIQYGIMCRQMIVPIIGIGLTQYINQKRLFSAIWLPVLLISLSWIALIPILQASSNMTLHHWNPRHDILLGLYILLSLMLLQSFCSLLRRHFVSIPLLSHGASIVYVQLEYK